MNCFFLEGKNQYVNQTWTVFTWAMHVGEINQAFQREPSIFDSSRRFQDDIAFINIAMKNACKKINENISMCKIQLQALAEKNTISDHMRVTLKLLIPPPP